ncbi:MULTISPECIES: class III poly(R)-hydroxyalkanoic acid synthase subunit PhaE [Stenotrophomonas]|uniref:class III poly(R)-hydroxyalkanoic acid synthase subunit PhaE n=1 Tax=Stenotrophomonas TaxID=40323 RepID=UPI001CF45757|nr:MULTISPECIES: class III poly(R)-hydroxyalkanoic acid synthase subunit PhaE [Stenotrophomonas]MCA7024743.1 class III poly(R)-hydroxyalkanoic acid synthase subunit PhaE [Stenotrophomonas acidaminiphila]MCE4074499.1 class III poly(R)-hydroxyalkanoic acid synthase subunit PhaE [Stenotrophomonas acidaminiphila]
MAEDNDSTGFDAGLKRAWEAWQQAVGQGAAGAPDAFPWQEGIAQWTRLVSTGAAPQVHELGARFQQQAGDWLGTMQQVAARFAGRDSSAAEVAGAWRDAVEGQGDAMVRWMLDAARGGNALGDQPWIRDFVHALQSGHGEGGWLNAPTFGPAREHQARWQALLRAQQEHQARMEAYVGSIRGVLDDAFHRFEAKLAEHEAPGSQLTSARAMFDLWIDAAEEAYATVAMSEDFQRIYADLANTQMRLRAATQHELERACELMGVPTRTEMDAAHRRIAELERWMRRMAATGTAPAPAPAPAPAKARARTTAKSTVKSKSAHGGGAAPKNRPAAATKAGKPAAPASVRAARTASRPATPRRGGKP